MADMKSMLTKKIGPLPAWGWGVVVGGGYLGYRLLSGKGMFPATETNANAADTSGMTAGGGSGTGSYGGESSGSFTPTTPADPIIPPLTPYESGKEQSLLEAYTSGEDRGMTLSGLPISPLAPSSSSVPESAPVPPGSTPVPSDTGAPAPWANPVIQDPIPTDSAPPTVGEMPAPTPQPGALPTDETIKLQGKLEAAQASSKGWKIWGVHWKDVAKERTSTNAGRSNTKAYKEGQAANKAKRDAKKPAAKKKDATKAPAKKPAAKKAVLAVTKRVGTAATGFVKPKPKIVVPPFKAATKPAVAKRPATAKTPAPKPAPKKPAPKKPTPKKKGK